MASELGTNFCLMNMKLNSSVLFWTFYKQAPLCEDKRYLTKSYVIFPSTKGIVAVDYLARTSAVIYAGV